MKIPRPRNGSAERRSCPWWELRVGEDDCGNLWTRFFTHLFSSYIDLHVRLYKMCERGYSDLMKRRTSARAKGTVVRDGSSSLLKRR